MVVHSVDNRNRDVDCVQLSLCRYNPHLQKLLSQLRGLRHNCKYRNSFHSGQAASSRLRVASSSLSNYGL